MDENKFLIAKYVTLISKLMQNKLLAALMLFVLPWQLLWQSDEILELAKTHKDL